ncbi:MAG: aldehyde dehydrogenase family protein, partial [Candidatus Scalindua sp.]
MLSTTLSIDAEHITPSPQIRDFIKPIRKMLIAGKWVDSASGKTFPVYNPASGEEITRVAEGDREDIDRAVKAGRDAFENGPWRTMTPAERSRVIWKIGDLIYEHTDELAELESIDNGKSKNIAAVVDIPLSADHFHYYAGW